MNKRASKLAGVFEARKAMEAEGEGKNAPDQRRAAAASATPQTAPVETSDAPAEGTRKKGRSNKANKADYQHTSIYISRAVHLDVKMALLKAGEEEDFSELVERLLKDWLAVRDKN
jgi:soluble lytic murein transglycosylase-like protein